ncbi:MAG: selenide, water dikinase SelD [Alphaproteobacteria bacterium]|nr:selenide, water dikinase SelD [Alphaproteobacteria bacterium]
MQQSPAVPVTHDIVLVGGGHAHVHVLKRFGMRPLPGVRVTLIARDVETPYSGMLPGFVAGFYSFDECHIDLMRLARFAGARLIHDEAVGLDRAARQVICRNHPPIRYDAVALDIGSTPRHDDVPGAAEHTIPVKPIDHFAERWQALLDRASANDSLRLAIVGAGAGGVELAVSAHHRLTALRGAPPAVTLVSADDLLPSHNPKVRQRFSRLCGERGITVLPRTRIAQVESGRLISTDETIIEFDEALWVTEAAGAPWLADTGLPLDSLGFLLVDEMLRSPADPAVFAAGDIATMAAHPRPKAGVYAVRAGPPLAENLRRLATDRPLRRYVPQAHALALIGSGDGRAVASRGSLVAQGRWLWRLKDWIDRRWMRGYTELPSMADEAGSEDAMRCGGCAAKVPAEVLTRAMARLNPATNNAISIGLGSPDDAALLQFPGAPPLLQTVDFFRAMVSDPYLFGRIAATHALGDIYAMGGVPETALAIAALPPARPGIVEHDLFHMLKGGTEVLEAAGAVLVGGHSAEAAELALGFAVTGRTRPGRLMRKGGLCPRDRLILTKPLGTGVILAAEMRGKAAASLVTAAIATMLQPASAAAACLTGHGVVACTDVTGFGLLGHLSEMLAASGTDARLDPEAIPALDGAMALLTTGLTSSLHNANAAALSVLDGAPDPALAALLIDPQTAGGLLAGVAPDRAETCLDELRRAGYRAAIIGEVVTRSGERPAVALVPGCASPAATPLSMVAGE